MTKYITTIKNGFKLYKDYTIKESIENNFFFATNIEVNSKTITFKDEDFNTYKLQFQTPIINKVGKELFVECDLYNQFNNTFFFNCVLC